MPTTHEASLDLTFIEHLSQFESPFRFPSRWAVQIETHFLGGARHFHQWEIADIGILVMFRRGGRIIRSKVGLLQSKRLYPGEQPLEEDAPADYEVGFARLYKSHQEFVAAIKVRQFSLTNDSKYKALTVGDEQYRAIKAYEERTHIPVFYLLYHPWRLPWTVKIPVQGGTRLSGACSIGCRVLPGTELRMRLKDKQSGYVPSYRDLTRRRGPALSRLRLQVGWRLEHFVVDLLLACREGYVSGRNGDEGLWLVFGGRSAPIAAAIGISIDAPD